jgi:1-acyl-sn-glycerol-3-phosphate acyltransferase
MGTVGRRLVSIGGLLIAAVALAVLIPLWLPLALLVDAVRLRFRFPIARLVTFGLGWAWLETTGVVGAAVLWATGRRTDRRLHYALQRWWAARLMAWLRVTTGIRIEARDTEAFRPGPVVLFCRHASLADSLVSAWVITTTVGMHPRYVLKRELLADPCLDVVGLRLPNHFLDRDAADSSAELDALRSLSSGMDADDVAVIFPEGTRAAPAKRAKALERIAARDPSRAERLSGLTHLLPPRPAGAAALLEGCPQADVVLAWHVGFDGLDTFGGILRHLAHAPRPVVFAVRRVPRTDVPTGDAFTSWLDEHWLELDRSVGELLAEPGSPQRKDP